MGDRPMSLICHTRLDLQGLAGGMYEAVRPLLSEGQSRMKLGHTGAVYGVSGMEMEGWARFLWMLAPLASGGAEVAGTENLPVGLSAGTDPDHPEYWGEPRDLDQRFVEMGAIGFALRLKPDLLLHGLDVAARQRIARWLQTINHRELRDCNWLFFRVLVNIGLREAGLPCDNDMVEADLERIESFYVGEGWYRDGVAGGFDHYNGFAFHFYGLLYAHWEEARDPERSKRFRARGIRFAQDFIHWFDPLGPVVPYGRSLSYRFGMAAFWSAVAFTGLPVFTPGVIRGILMRHLRWWFKQPIFDRSGILSLGYAYANLQMTENYNGPGSPYWSLKSLLVLALPPSDPFWQAAEEPLPKASAYSVQAEGRLLLSRNPDGQAILLNAGQSFDWDCRHYADKYHRFAYASRLAFSVNIGGRSLEAISPESGLWVSEDGKQWYGREVETAYQYGANWVASSWEPMPGVKITSRLEASHAGHVRTHEIQMNRKLHIVEGGFGLPRGSEPLAIGREATKGVPAAGDVPKLIGLAEVRTERGFSIVRDLSADTGILRYGEMFEPWPNGNLQHPMIVIPLLRSRLEPGSYHLVTEVELCFPG